MSEKEILATLTLTKIEGISHRIARLLIEHCGSAIEVLESNPKELLWAVYPILNARSKKIIENIPLQKEKYWKVSEKNLTEIKNINGKIWIFQDAEYPKSLAQLHDAPTYLFTKGNFSLQNQKLIGIVGTRSCTTYGIKTCEEIIQNLSKSLENFCIVSGLADGIDAIAHQTAVDLNIPTIGILGHGFDRIYPAKNKKLAEEMLENGGWISEFPFETIPRKENFPTRNRIVAGLCSAVIVIESPEKGGSMITANMSFEAGKELFAVPGRLDELQSMGCNVLIQEQKAHCFVSTEKFLQTMEWTLKEDKISKIKPLNIFTEGKNNLKIDQPIFLDQETESDKNNNIILNEKKLSENEKKVFNLLKKDETMHLEILLEKSNLSYSELSEILFSLEMQDCIKILPGLNYMLT